MERDETSDDRQFLVDAWRRLRHPRLAHLIDALDARAGAVVLRAESTKKRSDAKKWAEREQKGDLRDIHHLVATAGPRGAGGARRRVPGRQGRGEEGLVSRLPLA
jgi:hypothetical protein